MVNIVRHFIPDHFFISPFLLKDSLPGYKILGWLALFHLLESNMPCVSLVAFSILHWCEKAYMRLTVFPLT